MRKLKFPKDFPKHPPNKGAVRPDGSFEETKDYSFGREATLMKPHLVKRKYPRFSKLYPGKKLAIKFLVSGKGEEWVKEITEIQNIFSWQGLAPRVYEVFESDLYFAQLVEYVEGDYCRNINVVSEFNELLTGPYIFNGGDVNSSNLIGHNWIDFGHFKFTDYKAHKEEIKKRFEELAKWGGDGAYQTNEDLGVVSGRGDAREKQFELDKYNFNNKTVLDLGCSGGYFVNYCAKRGARAVGVDVHTVISAAREAANTLGIFNAEYYYIDLLRNKQDTMKLIQYITGIERFDYVFFLSMDQHIGFKEWLGEIADTLFFESNGGKHEDEEYKIFKPKLESMFGEVTHKGLLNESATRNLFVCKK